MFKFMKAKITPPSPPKKRAKRARKNIGKLFVWLCISRVLCFCTDVYLHCHLTRQSPLESTRLSSFPRHCMEVSYGRQWIQPTKRSSNIPTDSVWSVYKACHDELLQTLRYPLLMPYTWKQSSITKHLNHLGKLCNLSCSYMAEHVFNIRLTHFQHLDNQSLGFIPDINRKHC